MNAVEFEWNLEGQNFNSVEHEMAFLDKMHHQQGKDRKV